MFCSVRFESPDHIFGDGDYAYFSSSDSWLQHAKLTDLMIKVWVNQNNQVIEIAAMTGTTQFSKKEFQF